MKRFGKIKLISSFVLIFTLVSAMITIPETASASDTTTAPDWTIEENGGIQVDYDIDDTTSHSGKASLRIKDISKQAPNVYLTMYRTIYNLRPGTTYECTMWYKTSNDFSMSWFGLNNYMQRTRIYKSTEWAKATCLFTPPEGQPFIIFRFAIETPGTIWLDDMQLSESGANKNYFSNPGFEPTATSGVNTKPEFFYSEAESAYTSKNFTTAQLPYVFSCGKYYPVVKRSDVTIDADISDWKDAYKVKLPVMKSQLNDPFKLYKDEKDFSAEAALACDDEYIYMMTDVKDSIHLPKDTYWQGDSMQIAFGTAGKFLSEIGLQCDAEGKPQINASSNDIAAKIKFATKLNNDGVIYEAAIPWSILTKTPMDPSLLFDILVNDNDTGNRKYTEWTPGIGSTKDSSGFVKPAYIAEDTKQLYSIAGKTSVSMGDSENYEIFLANLTDEAKNLKITSYDAKGTATTRNLTLQAQSGTQISITYSFPDIGETPIKADIDDGSGNVTNLETDVTVGPTKQYMKDIFADIKTNKLPALQSLLDQCKEKGIQTDYEQLKYNVINYFISQGEILAKSNITRSKYVGDNILKLYNEATASLTAYLDGSQTPQLVPKIADEDVKISGYQFMGHVTDPETGKVEDSPIIFTGFGHFQYCAQSVPVFPQYGVNLIQQEIGPSRIIIGGTSVGTGFDNTGLQNHTFGDYKNSYSITYDYIKQYVLPVLQNLQDENMKIDVLLSPHYFPAVMAARYPETCNKNGDVNMMHPKSVEVYDMFLDLLLPVLKRYDCVNSICITNEPHIDSRTFYDQPYTQETWHQYLKDTHGDIETLNQLYGTEYKSFEEVGMPTDEEYGANVWSYDYIMYNQKQYGDFHEHMKEKIKSILPDMPVHAKVMGTGFVGYTKNVSLKWGVDPERYCDMSDINGCDAENYLNLAGFHITQKMEWYDMETSFKKAPVYNSEDHIIPDLDNNFTPEQVPHWVSDIWQGAIHRRNASAAWYWEKADGPASLANGNILERPDVLAADGKTNFDIARLTHEITALQNIPAKTSILYSQTSRLYSTEYDSAVDYAYRAVDYSGKRAGFITEKQLAESNFGDAETIVVPCAGAVKADTLTGLGKFVDNGGKLIILGDNCFKKNEYMQDNDAEMIRHLYDKATVLPVELSTNGKSVVSPSEKDLRNYLIDKINPADDGIRIVDADTGETSWEVEWQSVDYNGKNLVNICNYDWNNTKTVYIEKNGKKITELSELINGAALNEDGTYTLEPYTPKLVTFGN